MGSENYLPELLAEKDTLDPAYHHSLRLLEQGKQASTQLQTVSQTDRQAECCATNLTLFDYMSSSVYVVLIRTSAVSFELFNWLNNALKTPRLVHEVAMHRLISTV